MAGSEMEKTLQAALYILQDSAHPIDSIRLVRLIVERAKVDEASAKAAVLRLNFEGKIKIDSDLSVSLDLAECSLELELIPQSAAA
jgi:hypothetical protein